MRPWPMHPPSKLSARLTRRHRSPYTVGARRLLPNACARARLARWTVVTATILDGKATLATIKGELVHRIDALRSQGTVPGLGTVLVGDDPASSWYVAAKHRDCAEVGIASIRRELPADAT